MRAHHEHSHVLVLSEQEAVCSFSNSVLEISSFLDNLQHAKQDCQHKMLWHGPRGDCRGVCERKNVMLLQAYALKYTSSSPRCSSSRRYSRPFSERVWVAGATRMADTRIQSHTAKRILTTADAGIKYAMLSGKIVCTEAISGPNILVNLYTTPGSGSS